MRTKHEGTIQKVGRKFRGSVQINGKRFFGPVTARRADALPLMWQKLRESVHDQPGARTGPTFSTLARRLLDAWPKGRLEDWSESTKSGAETALAHWSKDLSLDPLQPDEVEPADLIHYRAGIAGAPSTRNRYQRQIEQLLSRLECPVKAPKLPEREPHIRILSREEQRKLLAAVVQPRSRLMIELLLEFGLRNGELCGLRHEDRHEDGIYIRVQVTPRGKVRPLKTDESSAWLPLTPELQERIGPPRKGYVIGTPHGTPMNQSNVRRQLRTIAGDAGIGHITPHELRHTAAVNLLSAGVDPYTVSKITRHSVDTLLKVYARATAHGKREALEKAREYRQKGA